MEKVPKRRVPLRLDSELADWADAYAAERGSSRTAVYEEALRVLRDLAKGGVPELESAASEAEGSGLVTQAAPDPVGSPEPVRAAPSTRASVPSHPKITTASELAMQRMRKMNPERYG